jgi:hypothetical protein
MKTISVVVGILVAVVAVGVYLQTDETPIKPNEVRLYAYFILLILISLTLAVGRLYNAIVANTRYLIKFQAAMKVWDRNLQTYSREVGASYKSVIQSNNSIEKITKVLVDTTKAVSEVVKSLNDTFKKR